MVSFTTVSSLAATAVQAPNCHSSQIRVLFTAIPSNSGFGDVARVLYVNDGATCLLPRHDVVIRAMTRSHAPVGNGSLSDLVDHTPIVLNHLRVAAADVIVVRASSMVNCSSKPATELELIPYEQHWPARFVSLPHPINVCTGASVNLVGGLPTLTNTH